MEPITRSKKFIGRMAMAINPKSIHFGRIGTIRGFRGDQEKGNPYVTIGFLGLRGNLGVVDTISARGLALMPEGTPPTRGTPKNDEPGGRLKKDEK